MFLDRVKWHLSFASFYIVSSCIRYRYWKTPEGLAISMCPHFVLGG